MPIYEYRCECGAHLESLERYTAVRERCGDLCPGRAAHLERGQGKVQRILSPTGIRGDGREAGEPTFNPVQRARRPGCDDCDG